MTIAQVPDLWVVEYSQSQRAFSVERLSETVATNLDMFFRSRACDHSIVAVTRTRKEAVAVCNFLDSRYDRTSEFGPDEACEVMEDMIKMGAMRFLPSAVFSA